MFSVVVPLYNKAPYLEKCLGSVLNQTFTEFEVIVVNDGSTDNGPALVRQVSDRRLRMIEQANAGVSVARNNGVQAARFDYIVFLDADDWLHPDFLQGMHTLIEQCPEAGLYGTNYFYVKNRQQRVEPKGLPDGFTSGYIDYVAVYGSSFCVPINCSFVAVRKSAFLETGGFRPNLRFGEDFDLWIRLALTGNVAYLNKPLAYSNQDVDSTGRALGKAHYHAPEAHYIFNLSYLTSLEKKSAALKWLLDGLRVRALLPYYLERHHMTAVESVLAEVDFAQQPPYYRLMYTTPPFLLKLYFEFRRVGSYVKQTIHLLT